MEMDETREREGTDDREIVENRMAREGGEWEQGRRRQFVASRD